MRMTILGSSCLAAILLAAAADTDTVTISRQKLEALERRAAEADQLRAQVRKLQAELNRLSPSASSSPSSITAVPPTITTSGSASGIAASSPAMPPAPLVATLPPLQKTDVVEAADLAQHYQAELASADARYRGKRFQVRGEIIALDKPMYNDNYKMILKTTGHVRVVCDVDTMGKYKAVFTAKHGQTIVARDGANNQKVLARTGETVTLEGRCKGFDGLAVILTDCRDPAR